MIIKKLSIRNFRSIKDLDIDLNIMTAFIGSNNAGKSNVLTAINLILGEIYPTAKSFTDNDFYNRDTKQPIEIKIIFDSTLGQFYNNDVWGFYLKAYESFTGIEVDYFATGANGDILRYNNGNEMRVSNIMREKTSVLFLGLNRDVESQLRTTQWSIFGKIIKHLNYKLPTESKNNFNTSVQNSTEHLNSNDFEKFKETMQVVMEENTGLEIKMEFQAFDPINLYRNLRVLLKEPSQDIQFEAQDMGRGVQGVLALGLLLSYKKLIRNAPILLIEEPETYLHPHACRHFYFNVKKLAQENIQVIYTTHSPFFIPLEDYTNIFLTRKVNGKTTVNHIIDMIPVDNLKFASMFNEKLNETLFASIAILVEGPVDKIFLMRALELGNVHHDMKNISVAECGGITEIKFLAKVLSQLGIQVIVLCDKDDDNTVTERELNEIKSVIKEEDILLYNSTLEDEYGVDKLSKAKAIKKSSEYSSLDQFPDIVKGLVIKLKQKIG